MTPCPEATTRVPGPGLDAGGIHQCLWCGHSCQQQESFDQTSEKMMSLFKILTKTSRKLNDGVIKQPLVIQGLFYCVTKRFYGRFVQ